MKKITRIRFWLWGVFLPVMAFLAWFSASREWSDNARIIGSSLVTEFRIQDVDKLTFRYADDEIVIARSPTGEWVTPNMDSFPVSTEKVGNFLTRLTSARAVQEIPGYDAKDAARYLLADPLMDSGLGTGIRVTLFSKTDKIGSFIAGKQIVHEQITGDRIMTTPPTGRYCRNDNGAMVCADPFAALGNSVGYWLRRSTFFTMDHIRDISLTALPARKTVWSLSRPNMRTPFAFTDNLGGTVDELHAAEFVRGWTMPAFLEAFPVSKAPTPEFVMNVRTAEGFKYTVWFGRRIVGERSYGCYWYRAERLEETITPDQGTDRSGRPISLPRPADALGFKFNNDKIFEQWAYTVADPIFDMMCIDRAYLLKSTQSAPAGATPKTTIDRSRF